MGPQMLRTIREFKRSCKYKQHFKMVGKRDVKACFAPLGRVDLNKNYAADRASPSFCHVKPLLLYMWLVIGPSNCKSRSRFGIFSVYCDSVTIRGGYLKRVPSCVQRLQFYYGQNLKAIEFDLKRDNLPFFDYNKNFFNH